MSLLLTNLNNRLQQWKANNLFRKKNSYCGPQQVNIQYNGNCYLSFCNNDYLGLANHPTIIEAVKQAAESHGIGTTSSMVVCGHHIYHQQLAEAIADFIGKPKALLFNTGYMANLGVISALCTSDTIVLQDRLNHASLIDGARLAGCRIQRYQHHDMQHLTTLLTHQLDKSTLVVSDGVFSMDGDVTPLNDLITVAQQQKTDLMIDDAHGIGVLGENGRGIIEHCQADTHNISLIMGTFSKAFGSFGAFVAADEDIIIAIEQFARSYIYTTSLPPILAAASLASLSLVKHESWRRQHIQMLIDYFHQGLAQLNLPIPQSHSCIQPILIGDSQTALDIARQLQQQGILVKAIRPPSVPKDKAILRISITAAHTKQHIDQLLTALNKTQLINHVIQ